MSLIILFVIWFIAGIISLNFLHDQFNVLNFLLQYSQSYVVSLYSLLSSSNNVVLSSSEYVALQIFVLVKCFCKQCLYSHSYPHLLHSNKCEYFAVLIGSETTLVGIFLLFSL